MGTLVQIYSHNAMKKMSIYKWVKWFCEGQESVNDERSGRPSIRRIDENVFTNCAYRNQAYYVEVLNRLCEKVRQKRCKFVVNNS